MKQSELRIGNLLQFKNTKHLAIVELIHNKHVGCRSEEGVFMPNVEVEPIPLTEEWLLKLGFNKEYKKGYIGIDFGNTDFVLSTPDNEDNNTGKYAWFFRQGRVPMFKVLDFVHQLQNLYFSLTGEELTLKQTYKLTIKK